MSMKYQRNISLTLNSLNLIGIIWLWLTVIGSGIVYLCLECPLVLNLNDNLWIRLHTLHKKILILLYKCLQNDICTTLHPPFVCVIWPVQIEIQNRSLLLLQGTKTPWIHISGALDKLPLNILLNNKLVSRPSISQHLSEGFVRFLLLPVLSIG